jgi:basic amino acid/polyamine antiporter, APA family
MGEFIAWLVGWNLILEYAVAGAAVAVGWSGYMTGLLDSMGVDVPLSLKASLFAAQGGGVNLIAVAAVTVATGLLIIDTRESAYFTSVLVFVKLLALGAFIVIAAPHIDWANFEPFMPYGFGSHEANGVSKGVMAAAALIFFAYIGFDAVSTAAEEVRNPNRNVPLGLIGTLVVCTTVYVLVAAGAVGTTPYTQLAGNTEPLASILRTLGFPTVGNLVALAAIVAGLFSVDEIAELSNTGTLFAFVVVAVAVMVLRLTQPDRRRPFRTPAVWTVGPLAVECRAFRHCPECLDVPAYRARKGCRGMARDTTRDRR